MSKFKVTISTTVTVEADTEEQAIDKAYNNATEDPGQFLHDSSVDCREEKD